MHQKDAGPVLGGNEARDNHLDTGKSPVRASQERSARTPIYLLRLRAAPGRDPIRALRALLKFAWRFLGLRAVSIREEHRR
jgi:hypothetical protein